jgi:hypothetical protein
MTIHPVETPLQFARACDLARPGDVIEVYPGRYNRATTIANKDASAQPIVIRAAAKGPISGGQKPDAEWGLEAPCADSPGKPTAKDFAFLVIDNCQNIVIDGLEIAECWPSIFTLFHSSRITIRNCRLKHGIFAVFAKGKADDGDLRAHHYLIENNHWQQDTSPDHKLWTLIDWAQSHGGEGSDGRYRYFNGAFFGGKGLVGDVVIRGNRISDAYNGIRLKGADTEIAIDGLPRLNANVHIHDNDFIRIRDNPIEPEAYARDWHVRHNRLLDCHSWFSVDGVAGGYWYFYGNTGWFMSRQGLPAHAHHTMGRVLKLSYDSYIEPGSRSAVPSAPWYVFNNSWYLRCPIVGGSDPNASWSTESPDFTENLAFFNNAMQWCDPAAHRERVCEMTDMVTNFDWARSPGVDFDHDVCSRADFKRFFAPPGVVGEPHGIAAMRPLFRDARAGDFILAPGSEAIGAGLRKDLSTFAGTPATIRTSPNGTLDMGAHQPYGLTSVPLLESESARLLATFAAPAA